jgi:hypothetical protein
VTRDVARVSTDAVERWYGGLLYVVNRFGFDNVQVIDPAHGYVTLRQFSVGSGSNPQDIAFASPTKAYVSRLSSPDLLIVDPSTGATLGTIPLAAWADGDGNPEAGAMTTAGDLLFVTLERLTNFVPADTGLVVVIDMRADTVFDVDPSTPGKQMVRLAGMNPSTAFSWLPAAGAGAARHVLIGCTGRYGVLDGGIDQVSVAAASAGVPGPVWNSGLAMSESALGGDVVNVTAYADSHSYAIASDLAAYPNTSLIAWNPATGALLGTVYAPGGYSLSDAAIDGRGELYVCNSSFDSPGLLVFRAGVDTLVAGPIATGLPPVHIIFGDDGIPAGPTAGDVSLGLPAPNPAGTSARFTLTLRSAGEVRIEVFDLAGRRVWSMLESSLPAGPADLRWDLVDQSGGRVRPGLYLVRATAGQSSVSRRVVVLK